MKTIETRVTKTESHPDLRMRFGTFRVEVDDSDQVGTSESVVQEVTGLCYGRRDPSVGGRAGSVGSPPSRCVD